MLTDDFDVAAIIRDAPMVGEQIYHHSADLLIIESQLPGAMSAIKAVRELSDDVKIIVLTTQEDCRQATEAIRVGAHAYISKQIEPEELICVLRLVRGGRMVLSGVAAKAMAGRPDPEPEMLSTQDRKLLELITQGLKNAEIARKMAVSESTLKRNIRQLLKKLNAHNKTELAVLAASHGLLEEW